MKQTYRQLLRVAICAVLLASLPAAGCQRAADFDQHLRAIVAPHAFSIARWELRQFLPKTPQPLPRTDLQAERRPDGQLVLDYLALRDEIEALQARITRTAAGDDQGDLTTLHGELEGLQRQRNAWRAEVQRIIGRQVRTTLSAQGIFNPLDRYVRSTIAFPPISFRLESPPHILIVSPRERIESIREIMLLQDLSIETIEDIESRVDALGVSSLVTEIGGFGATYPTFVADDASLGWTIRTVTEEWLHQYLAFTPLGFRYLLDQTGIARDYEIAKLNETLAGMVSDEIGALVMATYYPQRAAPPVPGGQPAPRFDFNRAMREIRLAVDDLLAHGEAEKAERFMEERRQYLASQGYYIRKLNQAYFAFYGTYADAPTSVDPVGVEMRELRSRSASLRDFLNRAAAITSHEDLIKRLEASESR